MSKREKRLEKQKKSLLEQAGKHLMKIETEKGEKDTTRDYWLEEAKRFKKQAEQRAKILEKLIKKKQKQAREHKTNKNPNHHK